MSRSYVLNEKVILKDVLKPLLGVIVISLILAINVMVSNDYKGLGLHPFLELRHFCASIIVIFIAVSWQKVSWYGFTLFKWGRFIAPISYSLYLSHQLLLTNAQYLDRMNNPVLSYILYIVLLISFCWLAEFVIYPAVRSAASKML